MLATPGSKDEQLEVEELASLLLRPAVDEEARSATPRALEALRSQVQAANSRLATPPSTPSSSALLDRRSSNNYSNFVGSEAGRLEVERARLEVELAATKERVAELEAGGRRSLGRDEVMSGVGEGGQGQGLAASLSTLAEARERAAVLIPSLGDQTEVAAVMGELLLQADLVASGAREAVEEVEGQLEVADKQLRSTRAFLEEQAAEREQEREEWEKRLASYKGRRESSLKKTEEWTQEVGEEEEEEEEGLDAGNERQKRREAERELRAAVDKIYELRDIIRTLETQMEAKVSAQVGVPCQLVVSATSSGAPARNRSRVESGLRGGDAKPHYGSSRAGTVKELQL